MVQLDKHQDYYYQSLYGSTAYTSELLLDENQPHIFHSSFKVENFRFTDRLDLYSIAEHQGKILFVDVGKKELCGTVALDGVVEHAQSTWENAEVFITHLHDDHDGNLSYVIDKGVKTVWLGPVPEYDPGLGITFMMRTGDLKYETNLEEVKQAIDRHMKKRQDRYAYGPAIKHIRSGRVLSVGGYLFEAISTPGHAYEHMSLLERDKGILFAGDHILDAAPGIMQYDENSNMLLKFLNSLRFIRSLNLNTVYLSHHEPLRGQNEVYNFITKQLRSYVKPVETISQLLHETGETDVYSMAVKFYEHNHQRLFRDLNGLMRQRKISIMYGYLDYLVAAKNLHRSIAPDGRFLYSW